MFTSRFLFDGSGELPDFRVENLKLGREMKMYSLMRGLYFITETADEENLA